MTYNWIEIEIGTAIKLIKQNTNVIKCEYKKHLFISEPDGILPDFLNFDVLLNGTWWLLEK